MLEREVVNIKLDKINDLDSLDLFNKKTPAPLKIEYKIGKLARYYQINGILKLHNIFESGFKRVLFVMPTGTGKTLQSKLVVLSTEVRRILGWKNKKKIRVLFIVHKKRLLRQAEKEFRGCKDIELITQSAFSDVPQHVIDEKWDITFIDEAHHEAMMSIQTLLDQLGDIPIVGFTANPNRGDSLLVKFEKFIVPISKKEAIAEGFISEPGINTIVDTGKLDKTDVVISVVEKYNRCMGNTIVFFKTNKECEKFHNYCIKNKLTSTWLNSASTEDELDNALDDLSKGRIQFLINCKKVDEGIDVSSCTDIILGRQFGTESEKEQLIGRCIRPDSPSTVWELINPYTDSIETKQVVGSYRFHRLIYMENKEWHDMLFNGVDETWGQESELRFEYIKSNLGYDPRIEDDSKIIDIVDEYDEEMDEEIKKHYTADGKYLCGDLTHNRDIKDLKLTKNLLMNAVGNSMKAKIQTMSKEELVHLARKLHKAGVI